MLPSAAQVCPVSQSLLTDHRLLRLNVAFIIRNRARLNNPVRYAEPRERIQEVIISRHQNDHRLWEVIVVVVVVV